MESQKLDDKLKRVFDYAAVDKGLARRGVAARLPRFIAEYLISRYYSEDPVNWERKLEEAVNTYYPDPKEKDRVLSRAMSSGTIKIIDEFKVSVNLKMNLYLLELPSLQIRDALVSKDLVKKYERLLTGLWGVGVLEYRPDIVDELGIEVREPNKLPFTPLVLEDFEPFQVYNVNLSQFIEGRRAFTIAEWLDILVKSIGLNPSAYSERQKLLLITRLVPLAEANVNLLELGPRATGKTYLYRNISYYTRIYAGGTVSPAQLFYNASLKALGDIGLRDSVIFDEVARIRFTSDEVVAKLKDYMVDGYFERGALKRVHGTCSLVFLGNVELSYGGVAGSITDYLPGFMKDTAILDRIHGLLPGWKLPKILKSEISLAQGYGLAADYLSEILHKLRDLGFERMVNQHVSLVGNYTIRDEIAVKRLIEGLVKLVFPHGEFDLNELRNVVELATELRQYVVDELSQMAPKEFPKKNLKAEVRG